MLFVPHCQEFAGGKRDELMKGTALPLAMWCTSAQGSSQARIQMAPVALWDLSTVLFPPFGAGRSHANAESAPQKFSHYSWWIPGPGA